MMHYLIIFTLTGNYEAKLTEQLMSVLVKMSSFESFCPSSVSENYPKNTVAFLFKKRQNMSVCGCLLAINIYKSDNPRTKRITGTGGKE